MQLYESIENNKPVCFTGIYNRIVDSINFIDKDVKITNKATLKQEILNKSSMIRNEYENSDSELSFVTYLNLELNKIYVEPKILTKKELDDLTSEWIDHI